MPSHHPHTKDHKHSVDVSKLPSSHGDSSVVQTPKDVAPHEAAAKDVTHRNVTSDDPAEKEEAMLDDAIDLTFPASDPIAAPSITKVQPGENTKHAGTSEKEQSESSHHGRKH